MAGSSVEIEQRTPASTSLGSGCSARDPTAPVRTFETIPLLILYEGSIWLALFFEKRWQRSSDPELATG